jgi:hypothetical protein
MMGRRQRNYRQTWSIVWERDYWHHIHFKAKRWANKRYRQQLKAELESVKNTEHLLQPDTLTDEMLDKK